METGGVLRWPRLRGENQWLVLKCLSRTHFLSDAKKSTLKKYPSGSIYVPARYRYCEHDGLVFSLDSDGVMPGSRGVLQRLAWPV